MSDEARLCKFCSAPLVRKRLSRLSGRMEEPSKWRARKFCDRACASASKKGMTYNPKESFARAISSVAPPPCEEPTRCGHYEKCAKEELACGDYMRYVSMGAYSASYIKANIKGGRTPSRVRYNRIFGGCGDRDG
jgi:hypothetical protein